MKRTIIEKIENLTKERGFIYTLTLILFKDLFIDLDNPEDMNWETRLNYQELSFLIGLMVKNAFSIDLIDEPVAKDQAIRTYALFKDLHNAFLEPAKEHFSKTPEIRSPENKEDNMESFLGSGNMMAESIFYGDSGACDFQFLEFSAKRYLKDKKWINANKGFELDTCIAVCKKFKNLHIQRHANAQKPKSFEEFCGFALSFFCFKKDDLSEFARRELENIFKEFSLVPGVANKNLTLPGEYNEIHSHPIVILGDNLYFIPILFNLAQSIYESPFYWMLRDKEYAETSFKNRGEATVDIAYDLLTGVFQAKNVYRQVKIEKNKKNTITDIDLLAVTGNKAIVLQIKSKKLTELSRKGDKDKLKQDFQAAIQEAYDQAVDSRHAILEKDTRLLDLAGNEIKLEDSINDVYIICVTSDHYPAVSFQTRIYLKKSPEEPFPIAISIFDLDVLAYYLKDPFEFLYFLRQRIALYESFIAQNEIELLGWHLNKKLYPVQNESGRKVDMVSVEGMADLIDAHFQYVRGGQPRTKIMDQLYAKWANPEFQEIINHLKESKQAGFTDAILFLYDLAGHGADQFINKVKEVKERCLREKKSLRFYMMGSHNKSAISYVCDLENDGKLFRHVIEYCEIKKYQTKSDLCLGLGGIAGSKNNFEVIMFHKSPWKQDPQLDEIAKEHYATGKPMSLKSGKKIGRNDLCWCGSGKKFKKCCGV